MSSALVEVLCQLEGKKAVAQCSNDRWTEMQQTAISEQESGQMSWCCCRNKLTRYVQQYFTPLSTVMLLGVIVSHSFDFIWCAAAS